jgi:hypothetical protein
VVGHLLGDLPPVRKIGSDAGPERVIADLWFDFAVAQGGKRGTVAWPANPDLVSAALFVLQPNPTAGVSECGRF